MGSSSFDEKSFAPLWMKNPTANFRPTSTKGNINNSHSYTEFKVPLSLREKTQSRHPEAKPKDPVPAAENSREVFQEFCMLTRASRRERRFD